MSDGLFSSVELSTSGRAGYRLRHLEVFNWGTFDKRVWRLTPDGETALLTGDIGSGKSTLVDAMTTLLLPAHKISYNKAAGAEARERTLRSYVQGHFKSERIEATGVSRPVGLRDHQSYSVLLAVFGNESFDETVTLAQVFHQKDKAGQPDRFFVTFAKELSIEADFTAFGDDLNSLRRRLRASGAQIHAVFPDYSRHFRRLLGIRSEQSMELFHQTVSMKSVGNLNEFVRNHMLEPVDATEKLKGIVVHFEDLTKAHDAVKRAREQLEALTPLVATCDRYDDALARRDMAEHQRDAVRLYVAETRIRLLTKESDTHAETRERLRGEAEAGELARNRMARTRDELIEQRARAGGDRVSELERTAGTAREQASERRERRAGFDDRIRMARLAAVTDASAFASLTSQVADGRAELEENRRILDDDFTAAIGVLHELRQRSDETRAELKSLAGRTSNLPRHQLDLRVQLCAELGLEDSDLPFAGELLDVAEEFAPWRGAAERVLRGFALSLLVTQLHYERVAEWVNHHRLTHSRNDGSIAGSRLVYERVATRRVPLRQTAEPGVLVLSQTLEIKDGPFRDYLSDELVRRADYVCVDSVAALRTESRAVTREGQVRSRERHEKDDRSRVDDPRSWVLGWVNERKVAALTEQLIAQQGQWEEADRRHASVKAELHAIGERLTALTNLDVYVTWSELDHEEATARAEAADAERQRLVAGSSVLSEIERRLSENDAQLAELEERLKQLAGEIRFLSKQIDDADEDRRIDQRFIESHGDDRLAQVRTAYASLESLLGGTAPQRAKDCAPAAEELRSLLQMTIDKIGRELGGYTQRILEHMHSVRRRWPEATTEMDANVEARAEFRTFHDRVAGDDLPKFEKEFKRQLNTNAIRELAQFNNWLRRQAEDIDARVARINEALGAIDYSAGRYITLEKEGTPNQEVREFQSELRAATTDFLNADDDQYSEQRFLDVQRIIERFRGRDGHADADRSWTRRVTDVRNWFTFSASERDRSTDEEWEHYRDSDGKSGGQKEKLAYTILAASLAYQFGLEWGAERSRDFRFAVIDEAFGRGSDASTRYALELFSKLGLQLLIVTPLQKVQVIAPYVRAIGFVDNPEGNYSRLQTMTIEEFHERRTERVT